MSTNMNIRRAGNLDPFKDQIIESQSELAAPAEWTLAVGGGVSLTIGTDSLVVLGKYLYICPTDTHFPD